MPALAGGFADFDWNSGVCGNEGATSEELMRLSEYLRCGVNVPSWKRNPLVDPVWEKAGSEDRGCEVHESLADKLWVAPTDDDGNSGNKGKGPKNFAEGAAQKVDERKYDEAITKLFQLRDAVDKSKPNRTFNMGEFEAADKISNDLVNMIQYDVVPCVDDLLQPQP